MHLKKLLLIALIVSIQNFASAQCSGLGDFSDAPTVSNITATSVRLQWNPVSGRSTYQVYYGLSIATLVPHGTQTTSSVDFTGLTAGSTYFFQVSAIKNCTDANGDPESEEHFSDVVSALLVPPAPVALAVQQGDITSGSFIARWNAANGAAGYELQVSKDNFNTFLTGYGPKSIGNGAITSETISNLDPNTAYSFRLRTVNASGTSGFSNAISTTTFHPEPTTQARNINFSALNETSLTINWTSGSGTERIVVVRQTNPVSFVPTDGSTNTVNANFAVAPDLGSGNKIVYRGNAATITVTGLARSTVYHVSIFELNGSGLTTNYLTSAATANPASISSLAATPTAQPTSFSVSAFTPTSLSGTFTAAAGGADGYLVLQRQGASPTGVPIDGTDYSVGNGAGDATVVFKGSGTTFTVNGLLSSTVYHYDVYAYNGSGAATNYVTAAPLEGNRTTLAAEPAAQPTALTFTGFSSNQLQGSFTAAANNPTGYLVLQRQGASPTGTPADGTSYTVGATVGDAKVIAISNSVTYSASSLNAATLYHFDVFAFNGIGDAVNYRTTSPLEGNRTTLAVEPTAHPDNLNFSLHTSTSFRVTFNAAAGTPDGYLIIRKTGMASAGIPVDGTAYAEGALLDGTIVRIGNGTTLDQTTLSSGTVYHYSVFPYKGSGAAINYLTDNSPVAGSTITRPSIPQALTTLENHANDIKVSWQGVTGAAEYELEVSASENFDSFVPNYGPKVLSNTLTNHVVAGLSPSTVYFFRIRARNASGYSENYSDIESASTLSGGGTDELSFSQPQHAAVHRINQPQTISVDISGGIGTITVTFFHKRISDTDFVQETVTKTGNTYQVTTVEDWFDDFGMEFYFDARDQANQHKTTAPRKILLQLPNVVVPITSFGKNVKNYQIISIPYTLTDTRIRDVFEEIMGSYDKTRWRFLRYQDGNLKDYDQGLGASPLERGAGYWFISKDEVTLDFGAGISFDTSEPFVLHLKAGWNQIGNPFPYDLNWQTILDVNGSPEGVGNLFAFEQGSFQESDVLKTYRGGFVFADAAVDINFPATLPKVLISQETMLTSHQAVQTSDWNLPITVTQGPYQITAGVGMDATANEGKDRFDRMALPRFIEYVEFAAVHAEFPFAFSTSIVAPQEKYAWTFTTGSGSGDDVELHWDAAAVQQLNGQLILHDHSKNIILDMNARNHCQAYSNANITLTFSTERLLDKALIELGQAYPNPFTDSVIVPHNFGTDDYTTARIFIYDMNGNMIWQYTVDDHATGHLKTISWNGQCTSGAVAPAGMYLYRLVSAAGNKTKIFTGKLVKK